IAVRGLTLDLMHLFVTNSRVFADGLCDFASGPLVSVELHVMLCCGYNNIQKKAAKIMLDILRKRIDNYDTVWRLMCDGIALVIAQMLGSRRNTTSINSTLRVSPNEESQSGKPILLILAAKLVRLLIEEDRNSPNLPRFTDVGVQKLLIEMIQSNKISLQIQGVLALDTMIETDQGEEDSIVHAGGIQALIKLFCGSPEVQNNERLSNQIIRSLSSLATNSANGFVLFVQVGSLEMLKRTPFYYPDARQSAVKFWESSRDVLIPNDYESDTEEVVMAEFNYPYRALVDRALLAENENIRARIAYALAIWLRPRHYKKIFVENNLLESLLRLYGSSDRNEHYDGAVLSILVKRSRKYFCSRVVPDGECLAWTPPVVLDRDRLSLARRYVSNKNYDVKFLLDNQTKEFNAHKTVLKSVSKRFGLMLGDWENEGDTSSVINL
ncbi:hypothetical protein KI387_033506, partial [Taxus chinensis]